MGSPHRLAISAIASSYRRLEERDQHSRLAGPQPTHSYRPEAYTTSLELESQLPDEQIADLLDSGEGYTGVRAYYRDASGQQKYETAGRGGDVLRLKQLYSGQAAARRAVDREWGRMQEAQA